ncbi:hypothetical protein ACCO45_012845 [Purpureocillium lilacinum]|uniref:Uncharacterized protein n=1 Tax=Purpureocillium lilacinum TaxID=33203 RepID=A0ACC4D9U8_PURLI
MHALLPAPIAYQQRRRSSRLHAGCPDQAIHHGLAGQVSPLLRAIRDRTKIVGAIAGSGKLNHFDLQEDKLDDVVDFVVSVIKRDYGPDRYAEIPPHGRWQHFEVGNVPRIDSLLAVWKNEGCEAIEVARRLIDLFFVSVLLDAGAGDQWQYTEPHTGQVYERSEGIAVASLHMFTALAFTATQDGATPMADGNGYSP